VLAQEEETMQLADRVVAVVTGAAGGIGRATSVALASRGAAVLLIDTDGPGLRKASNTIRTAGGIAHEHVADVRKSADVEAYVAAALGMFGRIDVFFNNAGIEGPVVDLVEYPDDLFDEVIAVNLRGVFLGLKHVLPVMMRQRSGSIINTASTAGLAAFAQMSAYSASKFGVVALTAVAAAEAGPSGVRVNAICPGPIETRMMRAIEADLSPGDPGRGREHFASRVPLGRYGDPEEIARVVCFLASNEASYVNGAAWRVDGGRIAVA
jgi:NAD(P)-dependent dehydrogenase (short-subunit alcohol dehydrogenase family)